MRKRNYVRFEGGEGGGSVERVCLKAEQKGAGHCLYYDAKHLRFAN